LARLRPGVRRG